MLRTALATVTLAMMTGIAAAQAVPGAADVGEYHERFVVDSNPFERSPQTGLIVEEALSGATTVPDMFVVQESIVMDPVPAAMPGPAPASEPAASIGLTPGAPLGSGGFTDSKVVAGGIR
ncbi:MAG TPA: hypothetical protein VHG92_01660 [Afifellaceae bacterium]|nr:hypothetical protein [Afifellaceae bacterium]